jgi:hypothetical protein
LTVAQTEPAVRGDTASGGVTKNATLDTGLEIKVPLFICPDSHWYTTALLASPNLVGIGIAASVLTSGEFQSKPL